MNILTTIHRYVSLFNCYLCNNQLCTHMKKILTLLLASLLLMTGIEARAQRVENGSHSTIGYINSNGRVENGSHSTIGYFSTSRFENGSHSTIGYYNSGRFENGSHSTIGYFNSGRVENGSHSTIGYVSNGRVENGSHSTIGYYDTSIKPEWVAFFFFFMKR